MLVKHREGSYRIPTHLPSRYFHRCLDEKGRRTRELFGIIKTFILVRAEYSNKLFITFHNYTGAAQGEEWKAKYQISINLVSYFFPKKVAFAAIPSEPRLHSRDVNIIQSVFT